MTHAEGDGTVQFDDRVTPKTWARGSAGQRQQWFHQGSGTGDMGRCNTFR